MTLLADGSIAGGVTLAFTERTGGVSLPPFASLNLGARCGDDPAAVAQNRALVLSAMGAAAFADRAINPHQVHGDHVVCVESAEPQVLAAARAEAEAGADAVVCTAEGVPVVLGFADCVPVVMAAPGGFAVVHSGWRGTLARIAAKALGVLCEKCGCAPDQVLVYVGPHVGAADYEVSEELAGRFADALGPSAVSAPRHLDLSACLARTLADAGVPAANVAWVAESTASTTDRFFSYRAEKGLCGRHAAVAWMGPDANAWTRAAECVICSGQMTHSGGCTDQERDDPR